jgi:hypothetical protein
VCHQQRGQKKTNQKIIAHQWLSKEYTFLLGILILATETEGNVIELKKRKKCLRDKSCCPKKGTTPQ